MRSACQQSMRLRQWQIVVDRAGGGEPRWMRVTRPAADAATRLPGGLAMALSLAPILTLTALPIT